ncbi:MAG: PKD domain-containing protein, partial [Bacteroidetes bacterium]|nr:PKD domain-containing protein [Bacteroidota bacterium]
MTFSFAQRNLEFIENKGQWPDNVLYRCHIPAGDLFLEKNSFTYNFADESDIGHSHAHHDFHGSDHDGIIHFHAYKVRFTGSLPSVSIRAENPATDYHNYFRGNDPSKWASHVKKFRDITYTGLYTGIDLHLYTDPQKGLKYDFLVQAGSDPGNIVMEYTGPDDIRLEDGNLEIITSVNKIIEYKPFAYQTVDGHEVQIACEFGLEGKTVTFHFPYGFTTSEDLIIDPVLIFATYTGSSVDNWGFTATFDLDGNVFSGGIVEDFGYPVSPGAYQTNFGGGNWDVGIIKYTEDGSTRMYATYLGGTGCEMPHSLVVNASNELLIFGTTGSSNFPVSANAYKPYFTGGINTTYDNMIIFPQGIDIYISKLSADGSNLLSSTYIGGTHNDGLNYKPYINFDANILMHGNDSLYHNYADGARGEIITDGKNHVFVATTTFSTDFPVVSAFQPNSGGKQEGIVFKFDSDLSTLLWSSYIGGSQDDAIYSLDTDEDGDVYIAGGTASANFPVTAGAYQTTYQGGTTDGFVAHISNDGSSLISCSFFGSSAYDQAYFVRTDRFKKVYIVGQTEASGSTLVYNAAYNHPGSGQFITKFENGLDQLVWSTVFGTGSGKPNISLTAFTVDVCDRIYLSGWGREWAYSSGYDWNTISGTKNMEVTGDAYQSNTDGQDFYIMVLKDDASGIDYASFFGEQYYSSCGYSGHDHVDGGTSRFDKRGHIYQSVCASCGSCNQFPTTPGAWSEINGAAAPGNNCNNAVFSFSFMDDFCIADFDQPPVACVPYTVNFNNNSINATSYYWDFGDNTSSSDTEPIHVYTEPGTYTITLIGYNSQTCNQNDTIVRQIQVLSNSVDTLSEFLICPDESVMIGVPPSADPNVTYLWSPSTGLSSTTQSNPYAFPSVTTTYLLVVHAGSNCYDSLYQTVNVLPDNLDVTAETDTTVCEGEIVTLNAYATENVLSYIWSTVPNPSTPINPDPNVGAFTVTVTDNITYYIRVNGENCGAFDTASVHLSVWQVGMNINPDTMICLGDTIQLAAMNTVPGDVLTYNWSPAGSIISGNQDATPIVAPADNTTYTVDAENQHGCEVSGSVTVNVDEVTAQETLVSGITCYGLCDGVASVIMSSGISPASIQWSNGSTAFLNSGLCEGTYYATVTDGIGCKNIISIQLTEPPELIAGISDTSGTQCNMECSGSAEASSIGGTPPYTYQWIDGQTTQTASDLCAGTYTVTITDANGCDTTTLATITDPSDLLSSLQTLGHILCWGDCTAGANLTASLGTPPYSYYWSSGDSGNYVNNLCAGNYVATIVDSEGCIRVTYFSIPQPQKIIAVAASPGIACYGDSTTAYVTANGGTGALTYYWTDEYGQFLTNTAGVSNIHSGIYYYTVTDANECIKTGEISLSDPPELLFDSLVTILTCYASCDGSIHVWMDGGIPPYSYDWSNGADDSVNTELCSNNYWVTMTDNHGCRIVQDFYVGVSDYRPDLEVTADDTSLFPGQSANLYATEGYVIYNWSPDEGLEFGN